jgi:hypothetical protein
MKPMSLWDIVTAEFPEFEIQDPHEELRKVCATMVGPHIRWEPAIAMLTREQATSLLLLLATTATALPADTPGSIGFMAVNSVLLAYLRGLYDARPGKPEKLPGLYL